MTVYWYVGKLNLLGYKGAFTIEREIPDGEQKDIDVRNAIKLLSGEIAKCSWDFDNVEDKKESETVIDNDGIPETPEDA